jgi:hypothetical protein
MIARLNDDRKIPFGKPLREHGVLLEWVAKSRFVRFVVFYLKYYSDTCANLGGVNANMEAGLRSMPRA